MNRHAHHRWTPALLALVAVLTIAGCGASEAGDYSVESQQLQEPMDTAAQAIDQVRGTRTSLRAAQTKLQRALDDTNDVITLLLPKAGDDEVARQLVNGARDQRAFLQGAIALARATGRGAIADAASRTEASGRLASRGYARLRNSQPELAGLLPQSASFNSGRLRDAARKANPKKSTAATPTAPVAPAANAGGLNGRAVLNRSCDPNIKYDPASTSCAFAQNVFRAYAAATQSGAGYDTSVVASGADGGTRSMTCTLDGGSVTCFGANEALVEFPRWASDAY